MNLINKIIIKLKFLIHFYYRYRVILHNNNSINQKNFSLLVKNNQFKKVDINSFGFKNYSQYEEDGIILFIFSIIGFTNRRAIEIGCGDCLENNTTNLIFNHMFEALLVDGDRTNISKGKNYFNHNYRSLTHQPILEHKFVNIENINKLIVKNNFNEDCDFLSIDLDGIQYWVLKKIFEIIKPRLVTIETHNIIPANLSISIPYDSEFYYKNNKIDHYDFRSCSISAINNLAKLNNYVLIGSNKLGFNTFLLRKDIFEEHKEVFKEMSSEQILSSLNPNYKKELNKRWEKVKNLNWVEV